MGGGGNPLLLCLPEAHGSDPSREAGWPRAGTSDKQSEHDPEC